MKRGNLLALIVFLGLLVWVFTFDSEVTRSIQGRALSVFSPVNRVATAAEDKVEELGSPVRSPEEIAAENAELLEEVRMLRLKALEGDRLLAENNRFRALLQFEKNSPLKLIPARVIGRSASTWWNTAVIDRGYLQRVAVDSPVVTDQGLVGKTVLVNANESTIVLITDEKCQVGARIQGSPERGILMGARGATKTVPDLRLRFLSKDADPEPGAQIYSSNAGGLFPAGILLGEVKQFRPADLYGEALVTPSVDLTDIEYVFVIERDDVEFPDEAGASIAGEEGQ